MAHCPPPISAIEREINKHKLLNLFQNIKNNSILYYCRYMLQRNHESPLTLTNNKVEIKYKEDKVNRKTEVQTTKITKWSQESLNSAPHLNWVHKKCFLFLSLHVCVGKHGKTLQWSKSLPHGNETKRSTHWIIELDSV